MPDLFLCTSCSYTFSVGDFLGSKFRDGYFGVNLLICMTCGTRHAVLIAVGNRTLEFYDYYDIVLTAVDSSAEYHAQRLIWSECRCTRFEAKKRLDNLPVRLAHRLWNSDVKRWLSEHDTTGMTIECPLVERERNQYFGATKDQVLLSAMNPTQTAPLTEWPDVPHIGSLTEDGEIRIDLQQCSCCSAFGSLASMVDPADPCPICKQPTLEHTGRWLT